MTRPEAIDRNHAKDSQQLGQRENLVNQIHDLHKQSPELFNQIQANTKAEFQNKQDKLGFPNVSLVDKQGKDVTNSNPTPESTSKNNLNESKVGRDQGNKESNPSAEFAEHFPMKVGGFSAVRTNKTDLASDSADHSKTDLRDSKSPGDSGNKDSKPPLELEAHFPIKAGPLLMILKSQDNRDEHSDSSHPGNGR